MENSKLKVLAPNYDENVTFYEVELDDSYDPDATDTAENIEAMEAANDKFLTDQLNMKIMNTFSICQCSMQEWISKNERRRAIMNTPPQQYMPFIEQEDIDSYKYAVIAIAERGYLKDVSAIVRECKKCHRIEYWGDIAIYAHLLAEITTNFHSHAHNNPELEDVSVDNVRELFGGDVEAELIETAEEEAPKE